MNAWGFAYVSAIVWRKVTKNGRPAMGPGYRVRTMHETIYLGVIGNPKHRPLKSIFDGVRRQHSRKPDEQYEKIERLYPQGPYLEMFARRTRPGWHVWGNQVESTISIAPHPTLHAGDGATPIRADSHSLSGTSRAGPGVNNPPRA